MPGWLIGVLTGVSAAGIGPFVAGMFRRIANGRVDAARERNAFYREVKADRDRERQARLELEERLNDITSLVFDLRDLVADHLEEHPNLSQAMRALESAVIRSGKRNQGVA